MAFKATVSFEIHWIRQYLVNFMGLVGKINTTVYKTEPILSGLRHVKLSLFLTLISCNSCLLILSPWLSLPTYTTHSAGLSLTNKLKYHAWLSWINSTHLFLNFIKHQIFLHVWGTTMLGPYHQIFQPKQTIHVSNIPPPPPPPPQKTHDP